jgi:hypothetical protein
MNSNRQILPQKNAALGKCHFITPRDALGRSPHKNVGSDLGQEEGKGKVRVNDEFEQRRALLRKSGMAKAAEKVQRELDECVPKKQSGIDSETTGDLGEALRLGKERAQ